MKIFLFLNIMAFSCLVQAENHLNYTLNKKVHVEAIGSPTYMTGKVTLSDMSASFRNFLMLENDEAIQQVSDPNRSGQNYSWEVVREADQIRYVGKNWAGEGMEVVSKLHDRRHRIFSVRVGDEEGHRYIQDLKTKSIALVLNGKPQSFMEMDKKSSKKCVETRLFSCNSTSSLKDTIFDGDINFILLIVIPMHSPLA